MKRLIFSGFLLGGLAFVPAPHAQIIYTNPSSGSVQLPPVIDAVGFVNFGTFNLVTTLPFETYSTLNYTNFGTMIGSPGYRFQHTPNQSGGRRMAANFVNVNPGVIRAVDSADVAPNGVCAVSSVGASHLLIAATNVVVRGGTISAGESLSVGANGLLEIVGQNVDLARAGLMVRPIGAIGDFLIGDPPVQFWPDVGFYDQYWASASFSQPRPLNSALLWDGLTAIAGQPGSFLNLPSPFFFLTTPVADSYINRQIRFMTVTNEAGDEIIVTLFTNVLKGATFVSVPPTMVATLGFSGRQAGIALGTTMINPVTGLPEEYSLRITDTLASSTNRGYVASIIGCPPLSSRPINYFVDRFNISPGLPGNNGYPQPDFFLSTGAGFYDTNLAIVTDSVTNFVVESGDYTAYGVQMDNWASIPPTVRNATPTNNPGRVKIQADVLDLTQTRIRAEGHLRIETKHLVSSAGAVVNSEFLSFDLGSTNGTLNVQNLAGDMVERLRGTVSMWSALWSNSVLVEVETWIHSETNPPVATNIPVVINVSFHAFMVDATALTTVVPVVVTDLTTHSTHTTISDNVTVAEALQINSDSFTLTGILQIPGIQTALDVLPLVNFGRDNAPTLRHFTNYGSLYVANEAHFGDDRVVPYMSFVNTGLVNAASIHVRASQISAGGNLQAQGPIFLQGDTVRLADGSAVAGNVLRVRARDLKLDNYQMSAYGTVELDVSGSLNDSDGLSNLIQLRNGITLVRRPASGDLLNTTIDSIAESAPSVRVDHAWAGEDRGATAAGFVNNAAVGIFRLSALGPQPLYVFRGTSGGNALYVDWLDLSSLTDLTNQLVIEPSLTIYYAAVSTSFVPPPWPDTGQPRSPEEYLDGAFGGRLRWVPTYAGANSSQVVLINGQPTPVNRALVNSTKIDSDDDGIPNVADTEPFASVPDDPFLPPPEYTAAAATYNGLFVTAGGADVDNSGAITIKTTARGTFTASLRQGGQRYSFKGQFSEFGESFDNYVSRSGAATLIVALQVNPPQNSAITGTVTDGYTWSAELHADRAVFNARTNAPFAGRYTVALPGPGEIGDPFLPAGDGFGVVTVSAAGRVKLTGQLSDGTKISQSTTVAADGHWPLFVPLYSGAGQLLGWLAIVNGVAEDISGEVAWIKPEASSAKYYSGGFNERLFPTGSAFNPALTPITGFGAGTISLTGGDLVSVVSQDVDIAPNNRATVAGRGKLTLTRNTGLVRGQLINPTTGRAVKFQGVLLQRQGEARGFQLGTSLSGDFRLHPR